MKTPRSFRRPLRRGPPPSRGELLLRAGLSLLGLGLVCVAVARHGIANAPALVEVLAVAGLFCSLSLWFALRALIIGRRVAPQRPGSPGGTPGSGTGS